MLRGRKRGLLRAEGAFLKRFGRGSTDVENWSNGQNAQLQVGDSNTLAKLHICLSSAWDAIAVADGVTKVLKMHCMEHGLEFPSESQDLLVSKGVAIGVGTYWLLHVSGVLPFEKFLVTCSPRACRDTAGFIRAHALPLDADASTSSTAHGHAPDQLSVLMSGDIVAHLHSLAGSAAPAVQACVLQVLTQVAFPNPDLSSEANKCQDKQAGSSQPALEERDLAFLAALLAPAGSTLGGATLDCKITILEAFLTKLVHAPIESHVVSRQLQVLFRGLPSGVLLLAFERLLRSLQEQEHGPGALCSNPLDAHTAVDQRASVGSSTQSALSLVLHSFFASTDRSACNGCYYAFPEPEALLQLALRVVHGCLRSSSFSRAACWVQRAVVLAEALCGEGMKSGIGGLDMVMAPVAGPASDSGSVLSAWLRDLFGVPFGQVDAACAVQVSPSLQISVAAPPAAVQTLSAGEVNSLCTALIPIVLHLREDSLKRVFAVLRLRRETDTARVQPVNTDDMDALLRVIRAHLVTASKRREGHGASRGGSGNVVNAFHSRAKSSSAASGAVPVSDAAEETELVDALRSKVPTWVQAWRSSGTLPVGLPYFVNARGGGSTGAQKVLEGLRALLAVEPAGAVSREMACVLVRAMGSHRPPLIAEPDVQLFCSTHAGGGRGSSAQADPKTLLLKSLELDTNTALCRELRIACDVLETAVSSARCGEVCASCDAADGQGAGAESGWTRSRESTDTGLVWSPMADELVHTFEEHVRAALVLAERSSDNDGSKTTLYRACTVLASVLQQLLRTVAIKAFTDASNAETNTTIFVDHYLHLCRRLLRIAAGSETMLRCLACCLVPAPPAAGDVAYVGAEAVIAMNSAGLGLACLEFPACATFLMQVRSGHSNGSSVPSAYAFLQTNRLVASALNWLHTDGIRLTSSQALHAYSAAPLAQVQTYIFVRCVQLWTDRRLQAACIADPLTNEDISLRLSSDVRQKCGLLNAQELIDWAVESECSAGDPEAAVPVASHAIDASFSGWLSAMDAAGPFQAFIRLVDADRFADSATSENVSIDATLEVCKQAAHVAKVQHSYFALIQSCKIQAFLPTSTSLKEVGRVTPFAETRAVGVPYWQSLDSTRCLYSNTEMLRAESACLKNIWPTLVKLTSSAVSSCSASHFAHEPDSINLKRLRRALCEQSLPLDAVQSEEEFGENVKIASWAFEPDCQQRLSRRVQELLACAMCVLSVNPSRKRRTTCHYDQLLKQVCTDFSCVRDVEQAQVLLETALGLLHHLQAHFRGLWSEYAKDFECILNSSDNCPAETYISQHPQELDIWRHTHWLLSFRPAVSLCLGRKGDGPLFRAAELVAFVKNSLRMSALWREDAPFLEQVESLSAALSLRMKCFPSFGGSTSEGGGGNTVTGNLTLRRAAYLIRVVKCAQAASQLEEESADGFALTAARKTDSSALDVFSDVLYRREPGIGWCFVGFFVALGAPVGSVESVLEFLLPRRNSAAESMRESAFRLLVETLCSCLVHMDRGFGLFSRAARTRNGKGSGSRITEQGLACSCISTLLPALATYLPGEPRTSAAPAMSCRMQVRDAAESGLVSAGLPVGVRSACLERLDESMDIYI